MKHQELPEFLEMFGHIFSVVETVDLNVFLSHANFGRNSLEDLSIFIRKDIAYSLKWAVLFHEINELSKEYYGTPVTHQESQNFDLVIFQVLVDNDISFKGLNLNLTKHLRDGEVVDREE